MSELALIILNWNGDDDTIGLLKSLGQFGCNQDVFLVDNGSKSESLEKIEDFLKAESISYDSVELERLPQFLLEPSKNRLRLVLSKENLGFAGANNTVAKAIAPYYKAVLLLNNDTEITENAFASMYDKLFANDLVAITCDIRYFSDKDILWNAGGKFTWYGDRKYYPQKSIDKKIRKGIKLIKAEFITGCALMVKSDYIEKNGLFTDKFFHGEEDFNLCLRLKKQGLKVGVDLESKIYHKGGRSLSFDKKDIRNLNKSVVNYTNRIIDQKEFKKCFWLWRKMYLTMVFVNYTLISRSIKKSGYVVKNTAKFSKKFGDVKKDNYMLIMNNNVIIKP